MIDYECFMRKHRISTQLCDIFLIAFYLVVYVFRLDCSQKDCCTLSVEMMQKGTFPVQLSTQNTRNLCVSSLFTIVAGSTLSDL